MREIKFRARRTDNGTWAYGYFVKTPITTEFGCEGQFLDTGKGRYCIIQNGVAHEIDIETLGQYTGLKDKNGKEIYEGDILKWKYETDNGYKSSSGSKTFSIYYNEGTAEYKTSDGESMLSYLTDNNLEVIGNIYENPELLK